MAHLTPQDEAMFAAIDRLVPGSILADYAQTMVERTQAETLRKVAGRLNSPLYLLSVLRDEFSWKGHDADHEAASPATVDLCIACRLGQILDWIMEATVSW
jgi:hypothetical protein